MIANALQKIAPHALFLAYLSVFSAVGVAYMLSPYVDGSAKKIGILVCYGAALVIAYVSMRYALRRLHIRPPARIRYDGDRLQPAIIAVMHVLALVFPFLYFADLGYIPIVKYLAIEDYYLASGMRHVNYENLSTFYRYTGEYYIRGFMPVWLVFCYLYQRRAVFYLMLLLTVFFTVNSLTKTTIVIAMLPLVILQLSRLDIIKSALTITLVFFSMCAVTPSSRSYIESTGHILQHGELNAEQRAMMMKNYQAVTAEREGFRSEIQYELYKYAEGLAIRIMNSQVQIIGHWLQYIPDQHPFLEGCGWRWYAKIKGCDHIDMPALLWREYYPDQNSRGAKGSVSAADYIHAYANFGIAGVVLSALALAAVLVALSFLYVSPLQLFAFNLTFVLLVLEAQLSTLLHSGGWFVGMLTYMLTVRVYAARSWSARPR